MHGLKITPLALYRKGGSTLTGRPTTASALSKHPRSPYLGSYGPRPVLDVVQASPEAA